MTGDRGKLGKFLKEVINMRWDDFCEAERDMSYTGYQSAVFSLVRTCAEGKLGAIRLAIERVDGKVETPVQIIYPKVYYIFPHAKSLADPSSNDEEPLIEAPETTELAIAEPEAIEAEPVELVTLSLRETLEKMADQPRILVRTILKTRSEVDEAVRNDGAYGGNVPLVKSVIAANLLALAEKNNFEAITEVFNQIDGKLVETIRILGDDLYLTQYSSIAPAGAMLNKDGIYQIEMKAIAEAWKQKFKQK